MPLLPEEATFLFPALQRACREETFPISLRPSASKKLNNVLRHHLFLRDPFLDSNSLNFLEYHDVSRISHRVYRYPFRTR